MRPTTAYALANVKVTSAEKLIDVRARQARRKALKPLLSERSSLTIYQRSCYPRS